MRKIIVGIKPSQNKTLSFNLYRATSASDLSGDTNALLDLSPIAYITESECDISAHCIRDAVVGMDTGKATGAIQSVPFTVKFNIIRDITHEVIMRVTRTDSTVDTYVIKFNGHGDIDRVILNDTEQDASLTVPRIDMQTVYMHNNTMQNVYRVTITYYTEVIAIEDTDQPQPGVSYLGPPLSYIKPITLRHAVAIDSTPFSGTFLQYLRFAATAPEAETQYHYRVIARDEYGNVSDPSNVSYASIDQELGSVKNVLFSCDWKPGVNAGDQQWNPTGIDLIVNDPVYAPGPKGADLLDITTKYHHQLSLSDIRTSYIHNVTQTSAGLQIPNIWFQKDKYYAARTKAFRVTSAGSLIEGYVTHSNVVGPIDFRVPIERLLVLRTEVDKVESLSLNLTANENSGIKIAEWVKVNGRYFDKNIIDESKLNIDVFRDPSLTYPVDDGTFTANTLSVFDDTVENGKIYRYDIYTWDDYNTESKMLSIYITCLE